MTETITEIVDTVNATFDATKELLERLRNGEKLQSEDLEMLLNCWQILEDAQQNIENMMVYC